MASCTLVSRLPRSLPPLPSGPAPTCVPCVEGRQRTAPHSSTFPPTEAPLQTLHMGVWGPARVRGQGHECYFRLVVDDYSRYTTVFPLRRKVEVPEVLINWIRGARRQLSERFGSDFPVLRLHSDRGGEFSSDLLRAFCRAEGIRQLFTLPASPQQNGNAERRIGMVMDVARTSMIYAAAPHFLWPFAVQYATHQINLQPRVSLPETSPTLRWTRKVGDASAFRVWGSRAFVSDTSADKLSSRADVMFDKSVSYYCVFPYRATSLPPPPLFLAPGTAPVDPLPPQGHAPSDVSQVDPAEPVEVAVDSGAARGAECVGAGTGGADSGGAEHERVEPWDAVSGGAVSGGSQGVLLCQEPLSPQRLREWYARRCRHATGAGATGGTAGAGAAGAVAGAGVAGGAAGARATGDTAVAGAARGAAGAGATEGAASAGVAGGATGAGATGGVAGAVAAGGAAGAGATGGGAGAGAAGGTAGAGAAGATGVVTGDPGAEGTGAVSIVSGGATRPQPPPPVQSQSQLQPSSPLTGPSPYSGPTRGLNEHRESDSRPVSPVSRAALPVRTARASCRVPRPPLVPGTHSMRQRPSTAPQRFPLPSPPASSLPRGPDPESDSLRAASTILTRILATAVTDPLFDSPAASALVAELVDFAGACRLDYAASLVAESASAFACPPSIGDLDALDIPTPRSYAEAIEGPYSSQWQAAMDAEMASWKSTGTYVDEVPPCGANIVSGMWIFRVKQPPGSPPVFKARYVARGFS
ncbi:unnamed protein product [Closterium sp. NIES-54]